VTAPAAPTYLRCTIEVATSSGAKNIRETLVLYAPSNQISQIVDAR